MSDESDNKAAEKPALPGVPFEKGDSRINRTRPGPGRPPDKIRAALRRSFDKRREILNKIADDEDLDENVRMRAIEMIAKYGLGTTITPTDTEGNTYREIMVTKRVVDAGSDS